MKRVPARQLAAVDWVNEPLRRLLDHINEADALNRVYSTGVLRLTTAGARAELLRDEIAPLLGESLDWATDPKVVAGEKSLERLARCEKENDFRLLHALFLISLWGVMETVVDDFVVGWIARRPEDLAVALDKPIRLPPASVLRSNARARAEAVFEGLRRASDRPAGTGTARFENSLGLVGLSGPVPPLIADVLYEMHRIRNVYAHCAGVADTRFLEDCSWFDIKVGQPVPITGLALRGYQSIAAVFGVMIQRRAYARLGIRVLADGNYWDPTVQVGDYGDDFDERIARVPPCVGSLPVLSRRTSLS